MTQEHLMSPDQIAEKYHPQKETFYPFRSLENFKSMHKAKAKEQGVSEKLAAATTLTTARKVVFGQKAKWNRCCRDKCCQCLRKGA
jgi:hypothetical protein